MRNLPAVSFVCFLAGKAEGNVEEFSMLSLIYYFAL
jgi:hypothetical protein